MGCFDITCPISGLPIKYEDPVRWSYIVRSIENPPGDRSFMCPDGQLAFPLLKAEYDDYGSINIDTILPEKLWKFIWEDNLKGTIKPYSKSKKASRYENTPDDSLIQALGRGLIYDEGLVFDPDRHSTRMFKLGPYEFSMWMVHEWAFNWVVNYVKKSEVRESIKQASNYVLNKCDPDFRRIPKYSEMTDEEVREYHTAHETHWIDSHQGILDATIADWPFKDDNIVDKETQLEYISYLEDTFRFSNGLHAIRKSIARMNNNGEQHEGYRALPQFTAFVHDKAVANKAIRYAEYGNDYLTGE